MKSAFVGANNQLEVILLRNPEDDIAVPKIEIQCPTPIDVRQW